MPPALKFSVDSTRAVTVRDLVRGPVTFAAGSIDDFIILKRNGDPLYNFATVVDDYAMAISHVIRGEEHLANTPKQLLLYDALGWRAPIFAHIPIILNEQRRKLSKRDGAAFVSDYQRQGFLADALLNFLALLGWSPGNDRELMSADEMIRDFRLENVVKHAAIFDVQKLAWMNKEYIKKTPVERLAEEVIALLPPANKHCFNRPYVEKVTALFRDRVHTLKQIVEQGSYFFNDGDIEISADALEKYCGSPDVIGRLRQLRAEFAACTTFGKESVEAVIRGLAERHGVKAAAYIHPLRVAVTGQAVSPGIFEVCSIAGRHIVIARLEMLIDKLQGHGVAASGPLSA